MQIPFRSLNFYYQQNFGLFNCELHSKIYSCLLSLFICAIKKCDNQPVSCGFFVKDGVLLKKLGCLLRIEMACK